MKRRSHNTIQSYPKVILLNVLHGLAVLLRPHSIILASCKPGCKPGFRPGLQPGFRQVRAGLWHAFDTLSTFFVENMVANLLHQYRHVEVDAAGLLVRARARQMECRKKPFQASQRTCWSWIFVTYFIIRAYHDVFEWFHTQKRYKLRRSRVMGHINSLTSYSVNSGLTEWIKTVPTVG